MQIPLQLVSGLALALSVSSRDSCVLLTDGEPDDQLAMSVMAQSPELHEMCSELCISVTWPHKDKMDAINNIFRSVNLKTHIYAGAASKPIGINNTNKDFLVINKTLIFQTSPGSEAIRKLLLMENNVICLIIGPCTDIVQALQDPDVAKKSKKTMFRKIIWHGGIYGTTEALYLKASYNWFSHVDATLHLLKEKAFQDKILIVNSRSHHYQPGYDSNNFPDLENKLEQLSKHGSVIKSYMKARRGWHNFLHQRNPNDYEGEEWNGHRLGDLVAAMVMLYPEIIKTVATLQYTFKIERDPLKFDNMIPSIVKSNDETSVGHQEEIYQHKSVQEIHDTTDTEVTSKSHFFKKKTLESLEKYSLKPEWLDRYSSTPEWLNRLEENEIKLQEVM